jgi:tartrate-resistant acid phosphatase type 5
MPLPDLSSRRRFLKQTFAFSAASLLGQGVRYVDAAEVSKENLQLLMFGDWGASKDTKAQSAVASGMEAYVKQLKFTPESIFLLGDNFYGECKGGVNCPRWKEQFEDMYPAEVFPGKCHAMLGNHDYDDDKGMLQAELDYAAAHPGTRWSLPAKWYALETPLVRFLVLDSNYHNRKVSLTADEKAAQMAWLEKELAKPRKSQWLVVMGHHPLYSNGVHGDDQALIDAWDILFREHKVDFYFCGHDHDLQHTEFEGHPTSFVVSGGGGARAREIKEMRHGPFGLAVYGFTHLEVSPEKFVVRHIDANRKQLHAFSKDRVGKVTILS